MNKQNRFRNYFFYKGKRYEYGTIVKMRTMYGDKEMTFVNYDSKNGWYMFKIDDVMCKDGYKYQDYTEERLNENLIEISDKIDTIYIKNHPLIEDKKSFKNELEPNEGVEVLALLAVLIVFAVCPPIGALIVMIMIFLGCKK